MDRITSKQVIKCADGTEHTVTYCHGHRYGPAAFSKKYGSSNPQVYKEYCEMIDTLASYEDLEVTPEQIREIDKLYAEKCRELEEWKAKATMNTTPLEKTVALLTEAKLQEYQDAEENGLLLRLPCKVGDTVYRIDTDPDVDPEIEPCHVDNIVICNDGDVLLKYDAYDGVICSLDSIVNGTPYLDYYMTYLIQEEAEAKLAEMEVNSRG